MVEVAWMHDHHDEDELDFPTEEGATTIGGARGMHVLWNKAYIFFEMLKPASQPSQPSSSPPGGPSDDDDDNSGDDNGSDGNGNDGGLGSTIPRSPCPNMSNPQGGIGDASGNKKLPPS
jgi:hypothetical protein